MHVLAANKQHTQQKRPPNKSEIVNDWSMRKQTEGKICQFNKALCFITISKSKLFHDCFTLQFWCKHPVNPSINLPNPTSPPKGKNPRTKKKGWVR